MLTQYTRYALKALLYIARHPREHPVPVIEIAEQANVPRKFLETILVDLKRRGFVISTRGKRGGYRLARPPEQIAFGEIIRQFEGAMALFPNSSDQDPASIDEEERTLRYVMGDIADRLTAMLNSVTLADAISGRSGASVETR